MPALLHLVTRPQDRLAAEVIDRQRQDPGHEIRVIDLTAQDVDYGRLVEEIFSADAVQVW